MRHTAHSTSTGTVGDKFGRKGALDLDGVDPAVGILEHEIHLRSGVGAVMAGAHAGGQEGEDLGEAIALLPSMPRALPVWLRLIMHPCW